MCLTRKRTSPTFCPQGRTSFQEPLDSLQLLDSESSLLLWLLCGCIRFSGLGHLSPGRTAFPLTWTSCRDNRVERQSSSHSSVTLEAISRVVLVSEGNRRTFQDSCIINQVTNVFLRTLAGIDASLVI